MAGEIELLTQRPLAFVVGHDASNLAGRAPQISTPYLGVVASGRLPTSKHDSPDTQQMSRVQHYARANMSGTQFKYLNYYGPSETAPGAALTLHASIEYPLGTFTALTFDGAGSVVIADGADILSDPLAVFIPDGVLFREWTHIVNPAGALFSNTTYRVDMAVSGASVADTTLTGDTTEMAFSSAAYGATAIIGMTDKPSVLIIGDSRECGAGSYASYGGNDVGTVARPIGGAFGYINLASTGASVWQYAFNATAKLKDLANYCSHIVIGGGINDIVGGDSAASVKSNVELVIGDYNPNGDKPTYLLTVAPQTTSTDNWVTETNQTIADSGQNDVRTAYNAYVRTGAIAGAWGYFDIAAKVESGENPGKWLAPGFSLTDDGLHGNIAGELAMFSAIDPSHFGSKAYVAA